MIVAIYLILFLMVNPVGLLGQIFSPFDYNTSNNTLIVDANTLTINTQSGSELPYIETNGQTYYGVYEFQTAVIDDKNYDANVAVFCFDEIAIKENVNISISGTRALALLSRGSIVLESNLDIKSSGISNYGVGVSPNSPGTGGGHAGWGQWAYNSSTGWQYRGGYNYGEETLSLALLGGSKGGTGKNGGTPGYGGGAVALIASDTLHLNATIIANGGNPALLYWSGGGGSGGSVLLYAPTLEFGTESAIEALGGVSPKTMCPGTSGSAGRVAIYYNQLIGFDENLVSIYSRPGSVAGWCPDGSDGYGTLYMEKPEVTLQYPNGGEKLLTGKYCTIEWIAETAMGISNVRLEYSSDNGESWTEIAVVENSGEYSWLIPEVESDQCLIRISDPQTIFTIDSSEDVFTIFDCEAELAGDITGDCYVNFEDFLIMAATWLQCANPLDSECQ